MKDLFSIKKGLITLAIGSITSAGGYLGAKYIETINEAAYSTGFIECEKKHIIEHEKDLVEHEKDLVELITLRLKCGQ